MIPFAAAQLKQVAIGNDAGWSISFHVQDEHGVNATPEFELSGSDYNASIDAALPDGLGGGAYRIVVENLADEQHARIRPQGGKRPLALKLHLFWRDANTGVASYLTNLVGLNAGPAAADKDKSLVAVLSILAVVRRPGARTYETEITAVEAAYAGLSRRVRPAITAESFPAALEAVQARTGVSFATWEATGGRMTHDRGEQPGQESVTFGEGLLFREAVDRLARALEHNLERYGRGMVLIRDGTVHLGKRPVPYPEGEAKSLTLATGLLDVTESGQRESDPFAAPEIGDPPPRRPATYSLTLKGRPDLKPGDVVSFEPPFPADGPTRPSLGAALAGALAAPLLPGLGAAGADGTVQAYVSSVRHTLSRTAGFVTVAGAVVIPGLGDDAWDRRVDGSSQPLPASGAAGSDPGLQAAEAVRRAARVARGETRVLEVGEVRSAAASATGNVEPPAQTETVWEGLAAPDGRPNGARRLAVRRKHPSPLPGVPYLSPFAWGKTGLVVPRYPGMRVALGYRNGQLDDPLELGALWTSGRGPASEPGDWWLSLPVDVPADRRSSIPTTAAPAEHEGKVTHDLTDAAGSRVVEVGDLTVRVGKDGLHDAGERPQRAEAGSVTIEHTTEHSKIVMRQDGSIELSGKNVTIDAGSGTITLKANKVDVQVQDSMEVR